MVGTITRRWRTAAAVALVATGAVALGGSAFATNAGTPGRWTVVASGAGVPGGSDSELGLARTANGALHVAWKEQSGALSESIRHRTVSGAGAFGPVRTVVQGWSSLSDPELVAEGGGVRVLFGGQRTTASDDPNSGLLTATAPASGAAWSASTVVLQRNLAGGARTPSATVTADGTSFQTWYGGTGILVHRGLNASVPDQPFTAGPSVTEFGPTIVDDAAGRLWVGWCGFGRNAGGLYVQRADPASGRALGRPALLPGSTTVYQGQQFSTCNLERTTARRTPMVARVGGGVFVAGAAGYPTLSRVLVWRIDGQVPRGSFLVGADARIGHSTPVLAAAPDGRVWVAWLERRSGGPVIAARRSNRTGTVWGEPVRVRAPATWTLDALNVAAQPHLLDVLGLMRRGSAAGSVQHTQLLPGLTLTRAGTSRSAGRVTVRFRVSDAGDPVGGARVRLGGGRGTAVTGANGVATFTDPARTPATFRVTAEKAGYASASLTIRCC